MPRASNPVDSVLNYFKHSSVEAAELTLHVVKGIIKDRKAAGDTAELIVRRTPPKPRKARTAKPRTLTEAAATNAGIPGVGVPPSGV